MRVVLAEDSGLLREVLTGALIDRGVAIPGVNDGFTGPAPDIGAHEFSHSVSEIVWSNSAALTAWQMHSGWVYRVQGATALVHAAWTDLGGAFTALASRRFQQEARGPGIGV